MTRSATGKRLGNRPNHQVIGDSFPTYSMVNAKPYRTRAVWRRRLTGSITLLISVPNASEQDDPYLGTSM